MTTKRSGPPTTATRPNAEDPTKDPRVLRITGCPQGCGYFHTCGVGEPIDGPLDYGWSAIWVGNPPKLCDLRSTAVAA